MANPSDPDQESPRSDSSRADEDQKTQPGNQMNDAEQIENQKNAGSGRGEKTGPHIESGSGRHEVGP